MGEVVGGVNMIKIYHMPEYNFQVTEILYTLKD